MAMRLRWNGFLLSIYLRSLGCKVGRGLKCLRLPVFRDIPHKNIFLGDHVAIGKDVVFEIPPGGKLEVGDHVTIGDYNRISTTSEIQIGSHTLLAENVSVRGSFHRLARNARIRLQDSDFAPVRIGEDVLIGAYSVVLQGAEIPEGAVIGAQSLVKSRDKLHGHGIFAGSPLKHIRDRE